jgi:hypothetical protein
MPVKLCSTSPKFSSEHLIGATELLFTLIRRLVASLNLCITLPTSNFVGLMKTVVSSSYKDSLCRAIRSLRGVNNPSSLTFWRICHRVSTAIMNKYDDSRSPCRRPRLCLIHGRRTPFSLLKMMMKITTNIANRATSPGNLYAAIDQANTPRRRSQMPSKYRVSSAKHGSSSCDNP